MKGAHLDALVVTVPGAAEAGQAAQVPGGSGTRRLLWWCCRIWYSDLGGPGEGPSSVLSGQPQLKRNLLSDTDVGALRMLSWQTLTTALLGQVRHAYCKDGETEAQRSYNHASIKR